MHSRQPVDWRSHFPLLLGILAACAFLALMTLLIVNLGAIPEGIQPIGDGNLSGQTGQPEKQTPRERDLERQREKPDRVTNAF